MKNTKRIGLALSGGGYRATAYHIGTLKKLNELGILNNIDVMSCISGGSILGAFYGLNRENFDEFEKKAKAAVKKNVILAIISSKWFYLILLSIIITCYFIFKFHALLFVGWILILLIFQFKFFPISKLVTKAYDKFFFEGKTLNDLPVKPLIAINASNLESGRQFTFSREKMSDSFYEFPNNGDAIYFKHYNFPIATAVAASTCVPFAFTPISIEKKYYNVEKDYLRANPLLIDGGLYDNQGVHKLSQKGSSYLCNYIIVSDAGNGELRTKNTRNQFILLTRTVDYLMNRIKNIQMMNNIYTQNIDNRRVIYQSLQWRVENCVEGFYDNLIKNKIPKTVWELHKITEGDISSKNKEIIIQKIKESIEYESILAVAPSNDEYKIAYNVSTNLWTLKDKQIEALIKCASSITEIQIKLYCPDLLKPKENGN